MSITSNWPLPPAGARFLTPQFLLRQLAQEPLAQGLYPIAMGYYPHAEKHRMQRQVHDDDLLIYCTEGQGSLRLETRAYRISAGDLIYLPRGMSHRYAADHTEPWSIYWVHFDGLLRDYFQQHLNLTDIVSNIGVQRKVIADFDTLLNLRNASYSTSAFIHGAHTLQQLLSYLAIQLRHRSVGDNTSIDRDMVEAFMLENIHGQLNLDALAERCRLSKFYFSKRFKLMTGHAPIQHFIHLKMQHACRLLDSTQLSIKQIAAELGYDDAYYFSRIFKKVIGLPPLHYRRHHHN